MKSQIETYQREIEIHKEVEKELAKRSHFCQKVIKRLKQELSEITQSAGIKGVQKGSYSQTPRVGKHGQIRPFDFKNAGGATGEVDMGRGGNDDLINFMEQKLE